MDIKSSVVKSVLAASIVTIATAYASLPKQPTEPVYVMAPFKFDSINIKKEQATLSTANDEYSLEVEFDAEYFNDGNGVGHNWRDVEVKEIKDIRVYSEDGEIQAYVDRIEISNINDALESAISEKLGV